MSNLFRYTKRPIQKQNENAFPVNRKSCRVPTSHGPQNRAVIQRPHRKKKGVSTERSIQIYMNRFTNQYEQIYISTKIFTLAPYSHDLFTCLVGATGHSQVEVHCEGGPGGLAEQSTHQPGAPLQNVPSQIMIDDTIQELEGRLPDNDLVCIACGCGDCTVGHWVRWCIVPIVAVHRLLGLKRYVGHLEEISRLSQRALTVCSLVVFHFRRLLRQEGAFLHQTCGERHSPVWRCRRICQEVSLNAHVQLRLRLEEHRRSGLACVCHEDGLTLVRTLPVHMSTFLRPPRGKFSGTTIFKRL